MSAATSEAKILPFSSDKPLTIGRYTVIDKRRKRGNWGIAYNVYDPVTKTRFVAKRYDPSETALHQLAERGLELDDITRNEFTGLNAPEKVVQSFVELDNNKPFLIMPPFRGDLEELITNDDSSKNYLGNGLSISEITSWITDMTKSLSGFHKRYNEAHGDIKPDNYFYGLEDNDGNIIDNGLWLGDSGTKTGSSTLSQNESRARMGSIYTRAPENFRDGSRPEMRSDVSATGTTIFKLLTGKFMFEDELDNSKDPNKYMSSLDNKILDSMIKKKLEVVPRNFRKFLYRSMTTNKTGRNKRYENGMEMKTAWEKTLRDMSPYSFTKKILKTAAVPVIATAIYVSTLLNVSEVINTHQITSSIDPETFEVVSSYANIDVTLYARGQPTIKNPKMYTLGKGEKCYPSIQLSFGSLPDSLQHSFLLSGSVGFEGYEFKKFHMWTSSKGKTGDYGYDNYDLFDVHPMVPDDVPEGATINLEVRLYNPDSTALDSFYKWHTDVPKLKFYSPGLYLCSKKIPVHILKKGQKSNEIIILGGSEEYISKDLRIISGLEENGYIDKSLSYLVRVPALGILDFNKPTDNVVNVSSLNPFKDLPIDGGSNDVQLIAFKDKRLVYQTFFKVKDPSIKGVNWDVAIPDTGFATRTLNYARDTQDLIKRYSK